MSFPSGKTQQTLAVAFETTRQLARVVKQRATDINLASLAGTLSRKDVMEFPTLLADALDSWTNASGLLGIGQYAKDQVADQTLVLGIEFTAMVAEATSVRDWIVANFPSNSGFLLERSFDVNGRMVIGILSTAQTVGLRTELDKLIAAIAD